MREIFITNCLFNVERHSETKVYTSLYMMQLRWMFLWDLKLSELYDDHNVQIKKKKNNAVNAVSEEWNTPAYLTFTSCEKNELVFQCRAQYKRKNTYFETICLDVIICTLTHIFLAVCFNMQDSKPHIWHFDSYMSRCVAAVYVQVRCACSRQGLRRRWMRRVWELHFLLDKEKWGAAAKPGVSQSFVTLDVCPSSPAAAIWSLSQKARLHQKRRNKFSLCSSRENWKH